MSRDELWVASMGFLVGCFFAIAVARFGVGMFHEFEIVGKGHAYYHPTTREFTWHEIGECREPESERD